MSNDPLNKNTQSNKNLTTLVHLLAVIVITGLLFTTADIYLQFTDVGESFHNKIWPPVIIIDSNPSMADIKLLDENNEVLKSAITPLQIRDIQPGNYNLKLSKLNWGETARKFTVKKTDSGKRQFSIPDSKKLDKNYIIPFKVKFSIKSRPQKADIFIDDKKVGQTPYSDFINVGTYDIRLEKEGFTTIGDQSASLGSCIIDMTARLDQQDQMDSRFWTISEKENVPKHLILTGFFRKNYKITSNPSNAKIYVNSKIQGKTPIKDLSLPAGRYHIKIIKGGYNEWSKIVEVTGNDTNSITANLTKKIAKPNVNVYRGKPGSGVAPPSATGSDSHEDIWNLGNQENLPNNINGLMNKIPNLPMLPNNLSNSSGGCEPYTGNLSDLGTIGPIGGGCGK
ncbi:MAG: PEGA domain-containing protein [Elusimicrobiota bacterium]